MATTVVNPFIGDGYSLASMTAAINMIPNQYGLLNRLGIFREVGISTRTAIIERNRGTLNLLPSAPWGGPPTFGSPVKRDIISFAVPHIPHGDAIYPSDVSGRRGFGIQGYSSDPIADLMAVKLETAQRKHAQTLEYLRAGALYGQVIDGDGTTVIVNYYTAFGITQPHWDLDLNGTGYDPSGPITTVKRYFEDNLLGETMDYLLVLCSGSFWDQFVANPKVQQPYQFWMGNADRNILTSDLRSQGFTYYGVVFMEYRGMASTPAGTVVPFIKNNDALVIPVGTTDVFVTAFAPAEFNETVDTIGLPYYAKQQPKDFNAGWDIWTESNPLPIVNRPDLVATLTAV